MLSNPAEIKSAFQAPGTVCNSLLVKSYPDRDTSRPDLHQNSLAPVVWFLNDDLGQRQSIVRQCFSDRIGTNNMSFKHLGGRLGKERLLIQMQQLKPFLLWIRLPGQATVAGSRIDTHNATFIASLFRVCVAQQIVCVVESTVQNAFWSQTPIKELISAGDAKFSRIRWCNLGIVHPQSLRPSSIRVGILSTFEMPNLSTCQCGSSSDAHTMDTRRDLDLSHNLDRQHHAANEVMTNQFYVVLLSLMFADLMTHTAIVPELRTTFEGYRIILQLNPSPLHKMCEEVRKIIESTNSSLRYPALGPDSSSKSAFPDNKQVLLAESGANTSTSASSGAVQVATASVPPNLCTSIDVFPTEARMKAKAKKAADPSVKAVKKKKVAELGYDDCGEDHSAIMYIDEISFNTCDCICFSGYKEETDPDLLFELNHEMFLLEFEADLYPRYWLYGSGAGDDPFIGHQRLSSFAEFNTAYHARRDDGIFVDCIEFCGGNARTSQVLIRRRHKVKVGTNFDVALGFDMLNPKEVQEFWSYMFKTQPLVVIMSPPCTGLAGFSGLNRIVNPDGWYASREVSLPLGDLAGHIAAYQLKVNRHFLCENPQGSELYTLPSWMPVANHSNLVVAIVDMCMAGLVDPENGLRLQKRSEIWASDERLVAPLRKYVCDGKHKHSVIQGSFQGQNKSHVSRIWTWDFAQSVASGVADVVRQNHYAVCDAYNLCLSEKQVSSDLFLVRNGVFVNDADPPLTLSRSDRKAWKCKACQNNIYKEDPRHSRVPNECRWPDVESVRWDCPACRAGKPRDNVGHTLEAGECRWHAKDHRAAHNRTSKGEPRDPRIPSAVEPTQSLRIDVGAQIDSVPGEVDFDPSDVPDTKPGASSSSDQPQVKSERTRDVVVKREHGDQASPSGVDWSAWDLGRSLQLLRSQNPAVVRRTLRMLHIRWWHASAKRMYSILQSAGVQIPQSTISEIVDTCRACRLWQRTPPNAAATLRHLDKFNQLVQHDLTFFDKKPIMHLICAFTRLSQGDWLDSKETHSLLNTFDRIWVRPYGPPEIVESDQESGLINDEAKVYFSRIGSELKLKGVGAHVRMLEKHHDYLRQLYLRVREQCAEEGINVTKELLLGICIVAKNSFFTVGNSTPMQAVFGRQPAILPNLEQGDALLDDSGVGPDGISRNSIRIREIACEEMLQVTSKERAERASRSKTRRAVQLEKYEVDDKVEIFRAPANKDTSGWRGPCKVTHVAEDGTVHVIWQGSSLICRPQDVRRALTYFCFVGIMLNGDSLVSRNTPFDLLRRYVGSLVRCQEYHGVTKDNGIYCLSRASTRYPSVFAAILQIASCGLHLAGCIGARVGHGVKVLEGIQFVESAILWWWLQSAPDDIHYIAQTPVRRVECSSLHENISHICFVQFLLVGSDTIDEMRNHIPSVPHLGGPSMPDVEMMIPPDVGRPSASSGAGRPKRGRSDSSGSTNPRPNVSPCLPGPSHQDSSDVPDGTDIPVPECTQEELDEIDMDDLFAIDRDEIEPDVDNVYLSDHVCMHDHFISDNNPSWREDMDLALRDPNDFAEFACDFPFAFWFVECPDDAQEGDLLVFRVTDSKVEVVIEREARNLTKDEIAQYKDQVDAAKLTELLKWIELKTFRRLNRKDGTNILDGRWVLTWKQKYVAPEKAGDKLSFEWIIKARLTARGFKDLQIDEDKVATYSGTANRVSQRIINCQAAQTKTVLFSFDIGAAFLRGVTFQEMAKRTGTPLRSVQFDFPPKDVHILRKLPGMADFNHVLEVLDFLKSMWGLNDAPRLFGITRDDSLTKAGLRKTSADSHFWCKHNEKGEWELSLSTHIDDLKGCGSDKAREALRKQLASDFSDDLKEQIGEFEHIGIKHIQDPKTFSVYTHQNHYVDQLHPINTSMIDKTDESIAITGMAYTLFRSLLGAMQWLLQTRGDIVPYVGCLQRYAQVPTVKHVVMINRVLRWCKHNKTGILYSFIPGNLAMAVIADSAYKCEPEDTDCLALRGFIIALLGRNLDGSYSLHILEIIGSKHKLVTRSTFAAELRNAIDAVDTGLKINGAIHEQLVGVVSPSEMANLKENGGFITPVMLFLDAKSVCDAIESDNDNSADKSMIFHVKALRHMFMTGQLASSTWLDTRDMLADGLTKGKIDRHALMRALNTGKWIVQHPSETWKPPSAAQLELPWKDIPKPSQ